MNPYKEVTVGPLNGVLDLVSMPELMDSGAVRFRQNFQSSAGRVSRRQGWTRYLSGNADLHDQLLPLQLYYGSAETGSNCLEELKVRIDGREHITLLHAAVTVGGSRYLFAATQSRIYEFNDSTMDWRIIGDGFGGDAPDLTHRFVVAGPVNDILVFTNNYDPILYYKIGDQPAGCEMRAVKEIPQLRTLRVYKAAVAVAFNDVILLMDVEIDGDRLENRILASDYQFPLSYDLSLTATEDSVASYQDLPHGHKILAAKEYSGVMFAYTTKSIYRGIATGSKDQPWSWTVYYKSDQGKACLAYPGTLVEYGTAHYYMGLDNIYCINTFSDGPQPVEWMEKAAGEIFAYLNTECCNAHVAGVWAIGTAGDTSSRESEIWFSWAKRGTCVPSTTMSFQPETKFADLINAGFTAFVNSQPDPRPTIAEWLRTMCVCVDSDLSPERLKESVPASLADCAISPTKLLTSESMTFDGLEVENYHALSADPDSLCAALSDRNIEDFCNECSHVPKFVAVSSRDRCLKEIGNGAMSREYCLNSETGFSAVTGFCGDPRTLLLTDMERTLFVDPLQGPTNGISGITYSPVSNTLFAIRNVSSGDSATYEYDVSGRLLRTITHVGFTDTEGICWMYGDTFAISEENPVNRITIVTINSSQTTLDRSNFTATSFSTGVASDNLGIEGCGYDIVRRKLYFTTEKAQAGVWNLWQMDEITGAVTSVCSILATVGAAVSDIADIYYDRHTEHVFMLSQEDYKVLEVTLSGTIIRTFSFPSFTQPEGLAFVPNLATMFIVGEPRQFGRFQNSKAACFTYTSFSGEYYVEGYDSILRLGPLPMGEAVVEKNVQALIAEFQANPSISPLIVAMRLGYSYSPLDPNDGFCSVVWTDYVRRPLRCPQSLTPEEYKAKNLRPAQGVRFPVFQTGRYFYVEMLVTGITNPIDIQSRMVPGIGGDSAFSSIRLSLRKV